MYQRSRSFFHLCPRSLRFHWFSNWSQIMHQTFVTMAPMALGNSGDFDFSLCKARVYAQHCGDIFIVKVLLKALLKSGQVNVKLHAGLGMESKPRCSMALWGRYWAQLCPRYPLPHRDRGYKWLVHYIVSLPRQGYPYWSKHGHRFSKTIED